MIKKLTAMLGIVMMFASVLTVVTATSASAGAPRLMHVGAAYSDGWVDFGDGTYQWVSTDCRNQLAGAGITAQQVPWNNAFANNTHNPRLTCGQVQQLLAGDPPPPAGNARLTHVGAAYTDGWVDYGDGTYQWVSTDCRNQLTRAGITAQQVQWNNAFPNNTHHPRLNCNQIQTLLRGTTPPPPPPPSPSGNGVPVYDTAWELPTYATWGEIDQYFDSVRNKGFTGVMISLLNHTQTSRLGYNTRIGGPAGYVDGSGNMVLNQRYLDAVSEVMNRANQRGLRIGLVAAWGIGYIHSATDQCGSGANNGPLKSWNANRLGRQIGNQFKNHPALEFMLLGGDNYCNYEDVNIWRNMASGLDAVGMNKPVGYHSPAGTRTTQERFAGEGWVDFLAPQTGHCQSAAQTQGDLNYLKKYGKPVFAAELRYQETRPGWGGCLHHAGNPVQRHHLEADARAAVAADVMGMAFGDWDRWNWCNGRLGTNSGGRVGGCTGNIMSTLAAPGGEAAVLAIANAG